VGFHSTFFLHSQRFFETSRNMFLDLSNPTSTGDHQETPALA
jgi:hypothetical protein